VQRDRAVASRRAQPRIHGYTFVAEFVHESESQQVAIEAQRASHVRCYRPSSLVQGVPIPWGVWAESHQFSRGTNNLVCKAHATVDRNVGSTERFLGSWNSRNFARYGGGSKSKESI